MLPVQTKTYRIFDLALAAANGLLACIYLALFIFKSLGSIQIGISIYTTSVGFLHVLYALSIYKFLARRSLLGASLIGSVLFISNLAVVILASGGFRSPFYALWLLVVLVIGIYRPSVPLGLIGLSTLYFVGFILSQPTNTGVIATTAISLGATYLTGALGFWLWHSQHTKFNKEQNISEVTQRLTREQVKSEVVIDQVGEGVIVVDKDLKIGLLNPAGVGLTGWPANEARGIDGRLVLPLYNEQGQQLSPAEDIFTQAIATKKTIAREDVTVNTRSNKKLSLSITVSPILSNQGEASGAVAVFRDITQSKLAERQRNEFISTASHEMRTPVAAVEGYISLALNPKVANIDESARKYLKKAQASTQHLGKLFQDLLAITRIEEGKLPSHPEVVDVANLIEQVIDELRFKAQKKNLKLSFNSSQQTSAVKNLSPLYYIYADPERIREVLVNLTDNAIKFTPQGTVEITLEGDDGQIILGVKDSGYGIAPEDVSHLFQKFYRIDNQATANIGGTGLGLYITRAIVEMYQGRIWVETALNKGSHFKVSLPRLSYEKAQELSQTAPAEPPAPTQNPESANLDKRNEFVATTPSVQVE